MFPVLLKLLASDVPESVKNTVVDSLWGFMSAHEDFKMAH